MDFSVIKKLSLSHSERRGENLIIKCVAGENLIIKCVAGGRGKISDSAGENSDRA